MQAKGESISGFPRVDAAVRLKPAPHHRLRSSPVMVSSTRDQGGLRGRRRARPCPTQPVRGWVQAGEVETGCGFRQQAEANRS